MSRRDSNEAANEPLDFEPSEHAIVLLKDFVSYSARPSLSLPTDISKMPYAATATAESDTAIPSSTSMLLLDKLHSLSTLLSSLLTSASSPSLPPSSSDVDRLLMSAAVENDKRPIPALPAVREKVKAWKAMQRLREREDATLEGLAGGADATKGRRWLAARRKTPEEQKEAQADDAAAEEQRRLAEEQHERAMLDSSIRQLTEAYNEGEQGGLTSHQWSMHHLHSTIALLQGRRDWYDQRDTLLSSKENRSTFERDRLMTAAAHLNGHPLVADGTLPLLGVKASEGGFAVLVAPAASSPVTRSPVWRPVGGSPRLSPLMAAQQRPLHHHSAAFTPLVITADLASATHSHSPSLSPPLGATWSLSDLPITRSPSASMSLTRPRSASQNPTTPSSTASSSPSAVRMGGFLLKKSPSSWLFSTWHRRHFRLSTDTITYHGTADMGAEPLGVVPLSSILAVEEREGGKCGGRFDVLVEGGKCFVLECEGGVEERRVWVSKIREQCERWREGSKLRSVQRDKKADSAGQQQKDRGEKKWWKDKKRRSQGKSDKIAAVPLQKAKEKEKAPVVDVDGSAPVQLSERVARGELEVVKEETALSAGIGSVLVLRDKTVAIPASWVPCLSPAASPPSASPTYGGIPRSPSRSPRSSTAVVTLPPGSVLQRQDGSYLLYALPLTASDKLVSSLFDSVSSLSHPNLLLPVLRGTTADAHFLLYSPAIHSPVSTPGLQHSTLSSHLRRLHRFDSPSIRHIAHQLVLTLGYLHSEDRTCNRLSIDCVHVTDKGEAVVADLLLGLNSQQRVQCAEESREAEVEGRVECMSPEQLAIYQRLHRQQTHIAATRDESKLEDVDESDTTAQRMIDWWRLGVLLYELSTGTPPFLLKLKEYSTPSLSSLASFASPSSPASRFTGRARLLQVLKSHASGSTFLLFPSSTPALLQSLITSLLTIDHQTRLGAVDDWREVLAHPFFTEPPSPLCAVDVATLDLLDHPQLSPPAFMQQNIVEAVAGGRRGASESQQAFGAQAKSAVKHYTYHYSLVVSVHNAVNVLVPQLPVTRPHSSSVSTRAPAQQQPAVVDLPSLYVHLQLGEEQQVSRTVGDNRSPVWMQTFEFALSRAVEEEDVQLQAVDGALVAEWAEQPLHVEVRQQAKDSKMAIQQQAQHVSVGQAECSVGQLLASAAAASPFALTLLTADGVPNGELLLDVSISEQKLSRPHNADVDTLDSAHSIHTLFSASDVHQTMDTGSLIGSRIAGSEQHDHCQHILAPIAVKQGDDIAHKTAAPHSSSHTSAHTHHVDTQRYQLDGVDLNLSYITKRLLCCATPRIDHHDVHHSTANLNRFLQQTHTASHVKTIMVSTRGAGTGVADTAAVVGVEEGDAGLVLSCDVCPLWQLMAVVRAMEAWLAADDEHVLLLMCEDGVTLSGLLACALLLFDGWCSDVSEAVRLFSQRRCKQPNSQPLSRRQLSYLGYLHSLVQTPQLDALDLPQLLSVPLRLLHVRVSPPPQLQHPVLTLSTIGPLAYSISGPLPPPIVDPSALTFTCDLPAAVVCSGDVQLQLSDGGQHVCSVVFHTRWVREGYVCWHSRDVDVLTDGKDGRRLLDDAILIELFAVAV